MLGLEMGGTLNAGVLEGGGGGGRDGMRQDAHFGLVSSSVGQYH